MASLHMTYLLAIVIIYTNIITEEVSFNQVLMFGSCGTMLGTAMDCFEKQGHPPFNGIL